LIDRANNQLPASQFGCERVAHARVHRRPSVLKGVIYHGRDAVRAMDFTKFATSIQKMDALKRASFQNQEPAETSSLLGDEAEPPVPESSTFSMNVFSFVLVLVIVTSALSHFSSSAYTKLFIDLLSSPPPVGVGMSAKEIGYVSALTSCCSIIVQFFVFTKISYLFGYAKLYNATLFILSVSWFYTPFVATSSFGGLWFRLILLRKIADISSTACYLLLERSLLVLS
jgi:hypothetical protein